MYSNSTTLNRFAESLGKKPYCSNNLGLEGTKIRSKRNALKHDYISLNQRLKKYIVLDIDREGAALAWEDFGLAPTITATNPENSHAHLMYELKAPVLFSPNARSKPQDYYLGVKKNMSHALGADTGYSGLITKNPFSDKWRIDYNNGQFDLDELLEYFGTTAHGQTLKEIEGEGRNCTLFNTIRMWAYSEVKDFVIYESWCQTVLDKCIKENTFVPALPYSEAKAIAVSIAKWTWRNRHNFGNMKNRGAAKVDKRLNISNRQKAGAEYTNAVRKDKTEASIINAVSKLKQQGQKLTVKNIQIASNVSRGTLYNYKSLWHNL